MLRKKFLELGYRRAYSVGRQSVTKRILWSTSLVAAGALIGITGGTYYTVSTAREALFPFSSKTNLNDVPAPTYLDTRFHLNDFTRELQKVVNKEDMCSTPSELEGHSVNNYTLHKPDPEQRPYLIVYPHDTEHVSQIMQLCHKYSVPVIPYSGGSSIEGQITATRHQGLPMGSCTEPTVTLVLDFNKYMNNIIRVDANDLDCVVQPGVVAKDLNDLVLEPLGLLFGPDGAPNCEIGGQIGTSCSGTNAFRYGTMKENVVNVTAVMADGTIIKTKNRPKKSSNGYNLTGLFIGSEGTLGVVTEATLKLHVKPKFETISIASFKTLHDATQFVQTLTRQGILGVNAIELLDANMMKAINFSGQTTRKWNENATLLLKIGSHNHAILDETIKDIENLSQIQNCIAFEYAKSALEQEELWSARKAIFWSSIDYGRHLFGQNVKVWSTDIAVPVSNLSTVIDETLAELTSSGLYGTIVGHVGDGNFHCLVMYNEGNEDNAMQVIDSMTLRALRYDGTCSGEHGIGTSKRKFLELELGPNTIAVMRKLKLALDPKRIMNPDKIFKTDPCDDRP